MIPPTLNQETYLQKKQTASGTLLRLLKYLLVRVSVILLTIFLGVFVTVVLANLGGQIDASVDAEVEARVNQVMVNQISFRDMPTEQIQAHLAQVRAELEEAAGLRLPYWPRQMLWTIKSLTLDWQQDVSVSAPPGSSYPTHKVKDIILTDLPHTLLLVGTSYLLLFLIGLPLALYLFRHQGGRLDRLITLLAPVSSIPSWVLCVLFILIFAVTLRILPPGGMYDPVPPQTLLDRIFTIFRHMILPVMAILFSLLWQYVYIWRTFFLLFAGEDYVELARAKGLPNPMIERQYILRPTLPYIITNFALMLVSFWQMSTALEKIVNWPGIGRLYIMTLPNFLDETFDPGVMPITLGIVVIFAYILGITVLLLDIAYALVDPRVRIGDQNQTARAVLARDPRPFWRRWWPKTAPQRSSERSRRRPVREKPAVFAPAEKRPIGAWIKASGSGFDVWVKSAFRELLRYPSAIFGLVIILLMVGGSLYAVIAYPYNQIGALWYTKSLTGKTVVPKVALPEWVNWFRADKLPPTLLIDSGKGEADKTAQPDGKTTITYTIDYPYTDFPKNILVYFNVKHDAKPPFALLTWITPDGREFEMGRTTASTSEYFDMASDLVPQRFLSKHSRWQNWFVFEGNYPTSRVNLLFADPASDQPVALPGTYKLRIDVIPFEPDSTLDAEFVLLGQVHGVAGTDYMGRDLLLPLLWGMPFALVFGLLGACITTFLSMAVAATGVWLGGWVDRLIQQLVETNMILPVIAIGVLVYSYLSVSIWVFLAAIVMLNVFGSPTKSFRAALLQIKDAPYLEAARAYGASNSRIIFNYLIPRILPILIPQLVTLIPSYVFLEATLGIFNVKSEYPTWGRVIYDALRYGANYGSSFWVLEPLSLLLLTGLAFAMLGFALERILNPRIRDA